MTDVWSAIRAEREALASDLDGLSGEQWDTPSLCAEWKVRDVVAHLISGTQARLGPMLLAMLRSGFNLHRMLSADARQRSAGITPAQLAAAYRETIPLQSYPPGAKPVDMLSDTIIHGQDIRRPLGLSRTFPPEHMRMVVDRLAPTNFGLGVAKRIGGLTLVATDMDWRHGSGPEVRGPGEALILAMTGRPAGLADLSGDGVEAFSQRMNR